tara:strand:- start:2584 stop:3252 length:669 start_codon:yes stop_codon:yes gene_type:complete
MTDLNVSMAPAEDLSAPTDDDKRLIDNIKNTPSEAEDDVIEVEEPEEVAEELELKQVVDEKVIFSDEVSEDPPSPPSKKKKPPSAKQREHLKKAREKALATRRAKAAERKKVEEAKKAEREKKRLEREQKQIEKEESDFQKQKKLQESVPPSKVPSSMRQLSEQDIIKLQQAAIEKYEVTRKARKQKKKEAEAKANHDKKVYQSISKAVGQTQDEIWASCFQ